MTHPAPDALAALDFAKMDELIERANETVGSHESVYSARFIHELGNALAAARAALLRDQGEVAQPVAWRMNVPISGANPAFTDNKAWADHWATLKNVAVTPLYERPTEGEVAALCDVVAERRRQVEKEGWTAEHDDEHDSGDLAAAATCYALNAACLLNPHCGIPYDPFDNNGPEWPWDSSWWKPTTPRRDLVKAAALILAEIERLDRLAQEPPEGK